MEPVHYEQVSLSRLLENARGAFERSLLSTSSRIVLWGSFGDADQLVRNFFSGSGRKLLESRGKLHLLDRRRKMSPDDQSFLESVESAAAEAFEYLTWARERDGQPIWHELLVSYCFAFENYLKTIAISFRLAQESPARGLDRQIFIPGPELNGARRTIRSEWAQAANDETPRVQAFFDRTIKSCNPSGAQFQFPELELSCWRDCTSAFQLRNAVVHSQARLFAQVELDKKSFYAGEEIELTVADLKLVQDTFRRIVRPLSPEASLDDLLGS